MSAPERRLSASKPPGAVLKMAMRDQRCVRCRNGLPLGRRSCDGARVTSSVSTVATLAPRSQESRRQVKSLHEVLQCHHSRAVIDAWFVVAWKQTTLGEHRGPRKTRQDSSSLGCAARRLTLSRYVARLKPRCGSLALSVMWYVLTVSQVGAMARFE